MNFRYRLMQFMSGRYGVDNLFYILFSIAAVLSIINIFLRLLIIQMLVYALMIYALFRVLSRNFEKRRRENTIFSNFIFSITKKINTYKERKADTFHIFKKCPSCKAILRLPRRIGVHKTVCPRCNHEFKVRVRK